MPLKVISISVIGMFSTSVIIHKFETPSTSANDSVTTVTNYVDKLALNLTVFCLPFSVSSVKQLFIGTSRKLLRIKVTPDLHLTYSKNGGNLGLILKKKI